MSEQPRKRKNRKYDPEFKRQALLMIEQGQSVASVGLALGISDSILHRWRREQKARSNGHLSSDSEKEIQDLRARLRQVEQERDILKKALSIFSRQT